MSDLGRVEQLGLAIAVATLFLVSISGFLISRRCDRYIKITSVN